MEEKEVWKPVVGFEDSYVVSNHGRICSKTRMVKGNKNSCWLRIGVEIQQHVHKSGYMVVKLTKNGKPISFYAHRIIAEAFIPNPNNLPFINHRDEDKRNNYIENLEWCDRLYNMNYGTHNERVAKNNHIPIVKYSIDGEYIKEYSSAKEAETKHGYNRGSLCNCCKGRTKTAYGFIWRYKNVSRKDKHKLK